MVDVSYRLAWPRIIFLTFRLADPRACVRACSGFSALRFFRAARRAFFRSSLFLPFVFAIALLCSLVGMMSESRIVP